MTGLWERWVRFTGREVDARPLVLVRVLVPLCILGDLLDMMIRGAHRPVLWSRVHGGLNANFAPQLLVDPHTEWLGPLLVLLLVLTLPMISAGVLARPAICVGLVASAQLGHFFTPGDRAIDRLLRTALLILLFSPVTARRVPARIPAWSSDLLKWLLVLVYLSAGLAKVGGSMNWLDPRLDPEVYRILTDPLAGRLDHQFWRPFIPVFWMGTWGTLLLELTPFAILTRHRPWWALVGAFMHLSILFTMFLGMFSVGMLAFYPLLLSPWTESVLDRLRGILASDEADCAAHGAVRRELPGTDPG